MQPVETYATGKAARVKLHRVIACFYLSVDKLCHLLAEIIEASERYARAAWADVTDGRGEINREALVLASQALS